MNVAWRVVASGTELRRLLGLPDVLPLCEVRARACERWLVEWLARIEGETEARQLEAGMPAERGVTSGGGRRLLPRDQTAPRHARRG